MTLAKADIANMRQSAIFYLAVNNMHQGYIDEALKQLKQASRECFDICMYTGVVSEALWRI